MNRETVLKHVKSIRLEHKILPGFEDLIVEFLTFRGKTEYLELCFQLLNDPIACFELTNGILNYFEQKYTIIKLEKLTTTPFGIQKELINFY